MSPVKDSPLSSENNHLRDAAGKRKINGKIGNNSLSIGGGSNGISTHSKKT